MALPRTLEAEVMDSAQEALDYDSMDHAEVNRIFVEDLLACTCPAGKVLDLGTGTARIPIELCRRAPDCQVLAVDLATSMLELARYNIEVAGLIERIQLGRVDAKQLPYQEASFDLVISNSIIHHIAEPLEVLSEAVRVTAPGGLLFFRDLIRPSDQQSLDQLVQTYTGSENDSQQKMFADSLQAALSLAEIRALVEQLGFPPESVQASSDRHWTWKGERPIG